MLFSLLNWLLGGSTVHCMTGMYKEERMLERIFDILELAHG
jgi:hypothetical protein